MGKSTGLTDSSMCTGTKLKLQVETLFREGCFREETAEMAGEKDAEVFGEDLGTTPWSVTSILATIADLELCRCWHPGGADMQIPCLIQ